MTAETADPKTRYNGLPRAVPSLPSACYYDAAHYARELREIWYRNWLFVGRAAELPAPRDFLTYEIGDQNILLLRDSDGKLRAFHNTCRHRGSRLCSEARGQLRGNRITCPYHSWTYDLSGALVGVPAIDLGADFDTADYPLYPVAVREWRGFVFVHLAGDAAQPLEAAMDPAAQVLDRWPLAELAVGHHYRRTIGCNWKVFWENYNECYHCPGVHPGLSRLVPLYGRGIMEPNDDPDWAAHADDPDPRYRGGLRAGAETWSADGRGTGIEFAGLTAEERAAGHSFITILPTLFLVGYVDHVRAIALKPLSAETTEMEGIWLFPPEALERAPDDVKRVSAFGEEVMSEDAAACELNQRGLHALDHEAGVLLPQEYEVRRFHDWVRRHLAAG
jgi:Rieske 2Fe-2S family protein